MRIAPSPVFLAASLFCSHALAAPAPAANVAAASKGLEAAKAKVAEAIKKVEGNTPSVADLDAAHAALNELKDAIDAGASQEPNDLDYAKAALAARKDLREKRDYVDARRAKLHIFEKRRVLDGLVATLKDKAKAVEAKEPSSADFDAARTAVKDVRKELAASKEFAAQDQAFGSFLTETEALCAKTEKATDDKWAALEGGKHLAKMEDARKAFAAALTGLSASSTDEQFKAAEQAGKELQARLDEGKVLENKDKTYGAAASKARAEYATGKKKADDLWSQTGVTRLKAEIEPAAKDLRAAAKNVRLKKPSDEQLAEARTAAIIVRKLLEKFDAEAKRSAEFGAYVEGVRGTLNEVEGLMQLKALDIAVRDFRAALGKLDKKAPSDDDFSVARSALLVLDKTLEPMNGKDPMLTAAVTDAKAWQREGKGTIEKRRLELDVAAQQEKVEAARGKAGAIIGDFGKPESGEAQVKEAEAAVQDILTALDAGVELTKRDKKYGYYDSEVRKRVNDAKGKIENKKLQLYVAATRAALTELLATAKAKLEASRAAASTDADFDAAVKAIEAVNTALEGKAELETKSAAYAAAAERGRLELMKRLETLEVARAEREARKKTVDSFNPALAAAEAAAASSDLRVQKREYEKAQTLFKTCKEDGVKLIENQPQFARLAVVAGNLPSTIKEVVAECGKRYEQVTPLIKPLAAMIAFEDGPKKAYEAAVALLAKGKKTEALAQFDECTATGVTLGVRNPDMKDRQLPVGNGQMTLSELTRTCTAKSRELLGKK